MASEKIANPFRVVTDKYGNTCIYDANDNEVLTVWDSRYWDFDALARELCAVMNRHADELVDAANKEQEDNNGSNN